MDTIWSAPLRNVKGPKYALVAEKIRGRIASGLLEPGAKLPPVRELAYRLGITPGTVARAYTVLTEEGLLQGEVGRGTFVARPQPAPVDEAIDPDARAWQALSKQTSMPLCETLDEFLDVLLALQMLRPHANGPTRDVVLFGNGGGTSVLAADAFARAGLAVPALPPETRAALDALELPIGASVANPIDVPANVLAREDGAIARRIVTAHGGEIAAEERAAGGMCFRVCLPRVLDNDAERGEVVEFPAPGQRRAG